MSRIVVATVAGLVFMAGWVVSAMLAADYMLKLNFAVQFVYFAIAGFVWVFPIRWLMLWAAHQR